MRLLAALLLVVGCGGTKFTGVPDDASWTTDGGGSDGAASDATIDGGIECTWSAANTTCPDQQYCEAPGCGKGFCAKIPRNENPGINTVCGCDGITYWNESVAHSHAMSVMGSGDCKPGKSCTNDAKCPNGSSCNFKIGGVGACTQTPSGTCWGLPSLCPSVPKGHECLQTSCDDECDRIKAEKPWYSDNTCPQ